MSIRFFLFGAIWLLSVGLTHASEILAINLTDLSLEAKAIFQGTCVKAEQSTVPASSGKVLIPAMAYTFEVTDPLKGKVSNSYVLTQLGDSWGPGQLAVDAAQVGMPSYRVGKSYLLFLNAEGPTGLSSPCGLSQGLFAIRDGLAFNDRGNRHILQWMDRGTQNTMYAEIIANILAQGPGNDSCGFPIGALKSLIREIVAGSLKTASRKRGNQ